MTDVIGRMVAAALLLVLPSRPFTDAALRVSATLGDVTYCSAPNGNAVLWVHIDVKYENGLAVPSILPMVTRVSGYQLWRTDSEGGPDRLVREVKSKSAPMFNASALNRLLPDPRFFEMLQPGGVAHRIEILSLAVGGPKARLSGGDYDLGIRVDEWPADRKWGQKLAKSWGKRGELLIESLVLPPITIHIQHQAPPGQCPTRVD